MQDPGDLHFAEVLYETLIGEADLSADEVQKHLWFHDLRLEEESGEYEVRKEIYNAYDEDIDLRTRSIDYERISDVA